MAPIVGIYASQISGHLFTPGTYDSIQTVTLGTSQSSVTLSSIPSTYKHLQVRIFAATSRATYGIDDINIQLNGDTGNNYAWHAVLGDGSTASAQAASTTTQISPAATFGTSTGGTFGVGVLDILDYATAGKNRTTRMLSGVDFNGTIAGYGGRVSLNSGLWINTAAVNSITFTGGTGNIIAGSKFALYGIKG
jgi:hypothetical protein